MRLSAMDTGYAKLLDGVPPRRYYAAINNEFGKDCNENKALDVVAVLAEIPLIVAISQTTGWNTGAVVVGVMVIGTPLLLGLAEVARRAVAH
ncbi:MAG: hypothetical protein AzoDbin1_04242 [Azoarcus sp.]|nr:hypothetical protein [Azoarcus sp.]